MSKKAEKILEFIGLDKNNHGKIVFNPKHYGVWVEKIEAIIAEKEEVETEEKAKKAKK